MKFSSFCIGQSWHEQKGDEAYLLAALLKRTFKGSKIIIEGSVLLYEGWIFDVTWALMLDR